MSSSSAQAIRPSNFENAIRPFLIAFIVLPISVCLRLYETYLEWKHQHFPAPQSSHEEKVKRLIDQVKSNQENLKALRTDRDAAESHSVRISNKERAPKIRLRDFDAILGLDLDRMVIRVEPSARVGQVASFLVEKNLQLEATLEMEDATLGGLALSQGMTTHSHVCGLVTETCESFEFVSGKGELIKITRKDESFDAIGFSCGTLGFLVALELRVVKAKEFVKIKYIRVANAENLGEQYGKAMKRPQPPFFLEAIIFSPTNSVLIEGELIDREDPKAKNLKINRQGRWFKEWYYKRVERAFNGEEELIPMRDYLMRHDRSMCMTMETVFPLGNEPWFRYLFGWALPPKISFLKSTLTPKTREMAIRNQVYQDMAFPLEDFKTVYGFVHEKFDIYPLLCYPCKVVDRKGMLQIKPAVPRFEEPDGTKFVYYLNLGIYGVPRAIREGKGFKMLHTVRELEALVRSLGGFQHTYCDTLQQENEFSEMFDHSLLNRFRKEFGSHELPSVYEKVKPELAIEQWLKEEKQWD